MRELNFTEEELKKEKKGNYIASGSEASIYLHNTKNKSENTQEQNVIMAKRLYDQNPEDIYSATGNKIGKPGEERFIKNLLIYKDNIKLTTLPLGIIKENGIIIGQLIKYYNNSKTLKDFFKENKDIDPISYYFKVLDIIEELVQNNICYEDVHGGNFLVIENQLKLIDFSQHRVKINEHYKGMYYNMFQNFASMVNRLNIEILQRQDQERLILPSEIKNELEHPEKSFEYIRNELTKIIKPNNKQK